MELEPRINEDLKKAMLGKDTVRTRGCRAIKSAILLAKTAEGASKELTPEAEISLLQKLVKQRKDSAAIYADKNRPELAQKELEEISVIETYLPEQLTPDEIKAEVAAIIQTTGATDIKDMGKVMAAATKAFAGRADNKTIADIVKQLLAANVS